MPTNFFSGLLAGVKNPVAAVTARVRGGKSAADLLQQAHALLSGKGEASGVARAAQLLFAYQTLEPAERLEFFSGLVEAPFNCAPESLQRAIAAWQAEPNALNALRLHHLAEPPRQELLRRLNLAHGGTAALVRMREDLLPQLAVTPALAPLDADFTHLFASWFNRGFLELRPIDWRTSAQVLEKIIRYEAVHEIASFEDLRRRLAPPDRRCFGFFHPALPDEPLIFVEVALTSEIPAAIAPLLSVGREPMLAHKASTAVFYSISNCQAGLRGVSFGNFLIKQVVEELKRELPGLDTFVTLSPVPGFAAWLAGDGAKLFAQREVGAVLPQALLQRGLAHYLLLTKTKRGAPLDAVARFHLGNGASLARVNWQGDLSRKGINQAHGFMVNYLYDLKRIEANHEALANESKVVAAHAVRRLLEVKSKSRGSVE